MFRDIKGNQVIPGDVILTYSKKALRCGKVIELVSNIRGSRITVLIDAPKRYTTIVYRSENCLLVS